MTNEDIAVKLTEHDGYIQRHEGRIKLIEAEQKEQRELVTSVAVLAEQIKIQNEKIDNITAYIEDERNRPKKRWEKIIEGVLKAVGTAIGGGIIGAILMWFITK